MRKILIILIFLSVVLASFAQDRKITVQVLDSETKKPVKNATAIIHGTTIGTVANVIGFFELTLKESQDTIVISSVGYTTAKLKVPAVNQFKISLTKEYIELVPLDFAIFNLSDTLVEVQESQKGAESNAMYPRGWKGFYLKLAKSLVRDSSIFETPTEVKFTVTNTGEVSNLIFTPTDKMDIVKSAFTGLEAFLPAKQNNLIVDQYFTLTIGTSRFSVVEESAEPVDGIVAFYKFINKNLQYPKQAKRMGVEGRVKVEFIVNRDGSLSDIKVVNQIGAGCDEEAVRLIKLSPPWKPGMQKGQPVRQKMTVPITFKLG